MRPSDDERRLAALAHASVIANIFNLAGLFAALLIWALERDRSAYVRAHALQAMLYQGLVLLLSIVLVALWAGCLVLSLLPAAVRPDLYRSSPPSSFWIALLGFVVPLGFGLLATLYGLYGAYQVYRGRAFRYPLAGRVMRETAPAPAAPAEPAPTAEPAAAEVVSATPPLVDPTDEPPADAS